MLLFADNLAMPGLDPKGFAAAAAAMPPYVRKNQADLAKEEQERFKRGVLKGIQSGVYSQFVGYHADMSHQMHSMGNPIGTQRFLPWHRDYLVTLELALRILEPDFYFPTWHWTTDQAIPAWLNAFTPDGVIGLNNQPIPITRNPGGDPRVKTLPSTADIKRVVQHPTYTAFTLALEGARPFGAHNQVHVWVGGTMSDLETAPADPLFWLHHAEIDRLWNQWQQPHADQHPDLTGSDSIMDPWQDKADDLENTTKLGYSYPGNNGGRQ